MFLDFFYSLRQNKVPVGTKELLNLLEAIKVNLENCRVEDFYYLSRAILVKSEQHLDTFDLVFGHHFQGKEWIDEGQAEIDEAWIKAQINRTFSQQEIEMLKAMGGFDELMQRFKELLEEQKERHEGGNKWIGTGGVSPFGNSGYNPEGFRIGGQSTQRRAIKVWEKRQFQDYRSDRELDSRNFKLALKRLRHFTRIGAEEELDLEETIRKTVKNAGHIDIAMQAHKKNNVKVLLLMDVGGSMDDHVEICEKLFTAAKSEFKHIKSLYFHNFIYENLWDENQMRFSEKISTWDIINRYNKDYKLIFIGDASMSPYEIVTKGGSVEHYNQEAGSVWFDRLTTQFPNFVWINPIDEDSWQYTSSIEIVKQIAEDRMYPMTLDGLSDAMNLLRDKKRNKKDKSIHYEI